MAENSVPTTSLLCTERNLSNDYMVIPEAVNHQDVFATLLECTKVKRWINVLVRNNTISLFSRRG